jgi:hypothetical protein
MQVLIETERRPSQVGEEVAQDDIASARPMLCGLI